MWVLEEGKMDNVGEYEGVSDSLKGRSLINNYLSRDSC